MNSQAISSAPVVEANVTTRGGSIRRGRRWALILAYVFLAVFAVFFLFPPYYMIITSFKTDVEISTLKGSPWIIHQSPTLYHYTNLLTNTRFPTFFLNTVIVTLCSVTLSMCISVIAAYSLARMRFFGSGALAAGIFLTYLVPEGLLFIQAVNFADVPVMAAYLCFIALVFVLINLVVDLLYYAVDPRLRIERLAAAQ